MFRVVREHVLEPIRKRLQTAGLGDRTDYLLNRLFGGDRGDMNVVEQLRRQQFASQIAAPIAIGMLSGLRELRRADADAADAPGVRFVL